MALRYACQKPRSARVRGIFYALLTVICGREASLFTFSLKYLTRKDVVDYELLIHDCASKIPDHTFGHLLECFLLLNVIQ